VCRLPRRLDCRRVQDDLPDNSAFGGTIMPYVPPKERAMMDAVIEALADFPQTPGQLNYVLTRLAAHYIGQPSYSNINEVIGVLECVKLELYRRLAVPYEQQKMAENGDVLEYENKD
jgi:hypothetical protein